MISPEAFAEIEAELKKSPIPVNHYRKTGGEGRSQAFGPVNRRCLAPDYSRLCWLRPYLYKLLLDFGDKYVKIPWTSITVNINYKIARHKDKNNIGESYLVAFGDFEGGGDLLLEMKEGDPVVHNIKYQPIVENFSQYYHAVNEWKTGTRYSLVYYTLSPSSPKWSLSVPAPSVRSEGKKWYFYRGEEKILPAVGLPHPLRGQKHSKKPQEEVVPQPEKLLLDSESAEKSDD